MSKITQLEDAWKDNKASFGDALIANFVKRNLSQATVVVSWDALHFQGLLSVETLTPREFLLQGKHTT